MTRSLLILMCALFSTPSFSAQIEIAQWLPWKFVENKFVPKTLALSFSADNMELNAGELKPFFDYEATVSGDLTQFVIDQDGMSAGHRLSSSIRIKRLGIDQYIVREVSGNVIRIHIKADCTPFQIQMNELRTVADLTFKEEGKIWVPDLENFSMKIPNWNLGEIQCSGIGGLGEEIQKQIKAALSGPAVFEGLLKEMISEKLAHYFYSSWDSVLASTGNDLTITGMGKPSAKGLLVYANLSGSRDVTIPRPDESLLSDNNPQLIFSREGFETLMKDRVNAMIPKNYNLQQVDGFAKLMKSRFLQLFVWPDLRRFSSSTPFLFSTLPDQSQLVLEPNGNSYKTYFNTNAVLRTVMGGSDIDYLQLGLGVQTSLNVQVQDGELILKTGSAKLSMSWAYGLLYSMLFRPVNRIATDVMISSMNSMFSNQTNSFTLPTIRVDDEDYKLQNWKQHNDIITMDWL